MCTIDSCGPQKAIPAIELPETDRRAFLAGALSLPLATVLAFPELAKAQAGKTAPVEISFGDGGNATGVIAMPARLPAPTVLLIHEWWGLNDQIKAVTAELAKQGYIALAIDLFDGTVATTGTQARTLIGRMDVERATDQLIATIAYLRDLDGSNGKVGTVGWCFGGGWSLNASISAPVDATVIYYGRVTRNAADLGRLDGPVLGHFATQDGFINRDMVSGFKRNMAKADKAEQLSVHWYEAHHAFANPTGSRYDQADAALAWQRTLAFFETNLNA